MTEVSETTRVLVRELGPSPHLKWAELACVNRLSRPFDGRAPGALIAPYPLDWRATLGATLGALHEAIRTAVSERVGRETPLVISSAYRTPAYDRAVGGRSAWHPRGRALDYQTPIGMTVVSFRDLLVQLADEIGDLGGLGVYDWGCHVDIRPRQQRRLARWDERSRRAGQREVPMVT